MNTKIKEIFTKLFKKNTYVFENLTIEPTFSCNYKCRHCFRTNNKYPDFFDLKKIETNLFHKRIYFKNFTIGGCGDCFSLPNINELFKYAKLHSETTSTLTHGLNLQLFLDEIVKNELLTTLTISMEGITEKTYEKVRGKNNYKKVMNNIELLNQLKKKYSTDFPKLNICYTCLKSNIDDLQNIIFFCSDNKINHIRVQLITIDDDFVKNNPEKLCHSGELIDLTNENIKKIFLKIIEESKKYYIGLELAENIKNNIINTQQKGDDIKITNNKYCDLLLQTIWINYEGHISPCTCVSGINLGNVYTTKLIDIIESKKYKEIVYNLFNDKPTDKCKVCMNYKKNFNSASYNGK